MKRKNKYVIKIINDIIVSQLHQNVAKVRYFN